MEVVSHLLRPLRDGNSNSSSARACGQVQAVQRRTRTRVGAWGRNPRVPSAGIGS